MSVLTHHRSVLVPGILKMGLRHKLCVARCASVVAVKIPYLFSLLDPQGLLLSLPELDEGVASRVSCGALGL